MNAMGNWFSQLLDNDDLAYWVWKTLQALAVLLLIMFALGALR